MSPDAARIDGLSWMRGHAHRVRSALGFAAQVDFRQTEKPQIAGNTENRWKSSTTYNGWRFNRLSIASRFAGNEAIPISGGSSDARSQTSAKTLSEIPKIENGCRKSPRLADRRSQWRGTERFSESKGWPRNQRYNTTSNRNRSLSRIPSLCGSGHRHSAVRRLAVPVAGRIPPPT